MSMIAGDRRPTQGTSSTTQRDAELRRREQAMDFFAARFGIRSAFIRVKTLSRVLGIGEGTIYSAIRAGTFFIPHRMLGIAPAVKLEDLADWYCQRPDAIDRTPGLAKSNAVFSTNDQEPTGSMESAAAKNERRKAIIEAALADMRKTG